LAIRALAALRLAWDIKLPTAAMLDRLSFKRIARTS